MAENSPDTRSWEEIRDSIIGRLTHDAQAGTAEWLDAFAGALLSSDLGLCDRLIALEAAMPESLAELVRKRLRPALQESRAGGATQVVRALTEDSGEMAAVAGSLAEQVLSVDIPTGHLRPPTQFALTGTWLEALGERSEAASAYFEAGKECGDLGPAYQETSLRLLTRACELDSRHASAHWYLADACRMQSHLPEPPYVDRRLLEQSVAAWNAGLAAQFPDADTSWAYVVRALINEQFAQLDSVRRTALSWEAVLCLERAIVLYEADGNRWTFLGRAHRQLGNTQAALHATARALELDADGTSALEERAAILADTGSLDDALLAIEKRLAGEPGTENPWALSVKAYILTHQEQYQAARELLDKVIGGDPENISILDLKATCCRMLGDRAAAREVYQVIQRIGSATRLSNLEKATLGSALLQLGSVEEAMTLARELSADAAAADDASRLLGLCHLARGEFLLAEEMIVNGLSSADYSSLSGFLRWELSDFYPSSAEGGPESPVSASLSRIKRKVAAVAAGRRGMPPDLRLAAEDELTERLRRDTTSLRPQPVTSVAAKAGIARLQLEGERWHDAAANYASLGSERDLFPEASAGLGRVLARVQGSDETGSDGAAGVLARLREALGLAEEFGSSAQVAAARCRLGDVAWREGQDADARGHFDGALALAESLDDRTRGDLHARMGLTLDLGGQRAGARASDIRALACYRSATGDDAGSALAHACKPLLRTVDEFWSLDNRWRTLAEDSALDDTVRAEFSRAVEVLSEYLDETFSLGKPRDAESAAPLVTPIGLEVGTDIVPLVDPESDRSLNGKFINVDIPAMRERLCNNMGVRDMPGINVRPRPSTTDEYVILLDDAAVANGRVRVGSKFLTESDAIGESTNDRSLDPETDRQGRWYPATHLKSETEFMLAHVEVMLRRHLDSFLGVDGARTALSSLPKEGAHAGFVKTVLADFSALHTVTRILRVLLKEGVPINDMPAIIDVLETSGLDDVDACVRALRVRLKTSLPGNRESATCLQVPSDWEQDDPTSGTFLISASPERAYQCLVAARRWLQGRAEPIALVTGDARLRPVIRRLIEFEFPSVTVLASDEVVNPERVLPAEQPQAEAVKS